MSEAMAPQEIAAALKEIEARDAEYVDPLPSPLIAAHHMNWSAVNDRRTLLRIVRELLPDARRYRYFRTRWEDPITWEHRTIYGPGEDEITSWDDERVGKCLDAAIDAALASEEGGCQVSAPSTERLVALRDVMLNTRDEKEIAAALTELIALRAAVLANT